MIIAGYQKLTLLDYPEHVACTIFLAGCNLRCPFCHNVELIENVDKIVPFDEKEIMDYLIERKGKIEGVCITGGEPLINPDIYDLIKKIKDIGLLLKLDTNGYFPDRLKDLLSKNVIDYVAMDIKTGKSHYKDVAKNDSEDYLKSIDILMNANVPYEFRTTCVKGIHTDVDFYEIREMIKGAKRYYLQDYRSNELIENLPYSAFEEKELIVFKDIVKDYVEKVDIRGV